MAADPKKLIGPGIILFLVPISLLINLALFHGGALHPSISVNALTPLVVILHVILTVDAAREWQRRRTQPDRPVRTAWLVNRFLVLICCPGLGWTLMHTLRLLPGGPTKMVAGTIILLIPVLGLVIFALELRRYIARRRVFAESAPRLHLNLTALEDMEQAARDQKGSEKLRQLREKVWDLNPLDDNKSTSSEEKTKN